MGSLILVAFVLAVAGGAIAYGGDRLGTYVGKKRISFKWRRISLRPRYTATLYTILSGSAIAVLTLVLLISLDSGFKRALLEGQQLILENRQYKEQNVLYQAQIAKEQKIASDATGIATEAKAELGQAQQQLRPIRQQLIGVQALLSQNRQTLQLRQRQLGQAQARLASAQAGLGDTNRQLRSARGEVQRAKQDVLLLERNVRIAQQQLAREQQRVVALTTFGTGLDRYNAKLQAKVASLKMEAALYEKRIASSQNSLIFRNDQELGRLVVKSAQPVSVIEDNLKSFLNSLGQTAEGRGAKEGVNRRAVVVAVPVTPGSSEYSPLSLIDENKAVNTLAQQIAARSSDMPGASVVVVARAVTNSFRGEQTSIRLQPYENVLIYPKGTEIASGAISGTLSAFQIRDALADFLTNQVRPIVLHQQLIPQTDPETGQPMIGSVDEATLQALVQRIEGLGGTGQVTAYASEDTYSSGPLHLRFEVAPVSMLAPPQLPVAVGGRA